MPFSFSVFLRPALIVCLVVASIGPAAAQQDSLSDRLLLESIEQLVNDARTFGDPQRGAVAFYRPEINCAKCHEAGETGRRLGPDLAEQRVVQIEHLIESILQPSAEIRQGFESALVQMDDGRMLTGILLLETDSTLILDRIEEPNEPLRISLDEVDDWRRTKVSTMPADLANQLSDRNEFLDLIAYLDAIAKGGHQQAAQYQSASAMFALPPLPEYEARVDHAGWLRSLNQSSFHRGAETYRLRCASCHGTLTEVGSMPTSLRFGESRFKHGNDPYTMYRTLTHGYGMMNPQRWMVPQQKYEVIHYIREHFLKTENPSQYFDVTADYLAGLPTGDTRGPKPVVSRPWTQMDYGHSMLNTIEVSQDGSNIAQKGIAIRLDDGPGGVESGSHWLMYDHDTMRVAGAWSGGFIDYNGIHFNGVHGRHPRVAGDIHFQNPLGPGWGRPSDGSFEDRRVEGRDGKQYGPLDRSWAHYRGLYRFGRQTIIEYTVGGTRVLETPGLTFAGEHPVFVRHLNLGERQRELTLQIAHVPGLEKQPGGNGCLLLSPASIDTDDDATVPGLHFDGATFAQVDSGGSFDWSEDFTILARIKTEHDGSILSQTLPQAEWIPDGKTFFIRGGRLTYDIGWVNAVRSNRRITDGRWHDVAMTFRSRDNQVTFYVDGELAGRDELAPKKELDIDRAVIRLGFTNDNFPGDSFFDGHMQYVRFYRKVLKPAEIREPAQASGLAADWGSKSDSKLLDASPNGQNGTFSQSTRRQQVDGGFVAAVSDSLSQSRWELVDGNLRLKIPPGPAVNFAIYHASVPQPAFAETFFGAVETNRPPRDLQPLTRGGPPSYGQVLETELIRGDDSGPFAADVLVRPTDNPWNAQLRLTGIDFLPDPDQAILCAWDGSVWLVNGLGTDNNSGKLTWRRVAAGLFQPLGIKFHRGQVFVTCRDQLVVLKDLNDDGEFDHYINFNNDHQVTEHFHEFAMGLQTDQAGNLYYAKSARHALKAVVPHHGTLLKVTPDGLSTEIIANGFRAANGVCINPDGSFVVTDQEGHWNPKNRINWVRPGGFYGNMFGYHDVTDSSDDAMDDPLCWITNSFDRSPAELLWVDSDRWGPLKGSLLNFSYGYGKIYVVPHEQLNGQMQGGMCELPIAQFPTGVMRGRFKPDDGQLYCCGMFAWAGNQQQPGGFYRIRYTDKPVHLPVGLEAFVDGLRVRFSGKLDRASVSDPRNYAIETWDLKRTANYGSEHYNEKRLNVTEARLLDDGQTIELKVDDIAPTWGMQISFSIRSDDGQPIKTRIHNTIHHLRAR